MEQELNQFNEKYLNYYKPQFKNQNVNKNPEFNEWYKNAVKYIEKENKKRGLYSDKNPDDNLLTISFCNDCNCYSICSFSREYSYIECSNCNSRFCIGCKRPIISINDDSSLCFRGYIKLLYIRTIYRRSGRFASSDSFNTFLVILCILFTPSYFAFVSNIIGFEIHPNKKGKYKDIVIDYFIIMFIFSYLRGILMLPYIIIFLPFTIILLISSIFSRKYYFTIAALYLSALDPGTYRDNDDI